MRIAYIWARPLPSRETDTQQVMKTVDALGECGAQVDLVVPAGLPALRRGAAAFEAELRAFYGVRGGFGVVPRPGVPPSRLELERVVHALASCVSLPAGRYDAIYSRSRGVTALCAARGLPVVFETYRRLGHDSPRSARLLASLAARPSFLGIVTHSELARASLCGAGVPEHKVATVYNGFDPRAMEPRLTRLQARQALGLDPHRPLACYTGHVRARKGMDALLAMARLTPEIEYLIAGGTAPDVRSLESACQARGLLNVRVLGWRPASQLAPLLYASDLLLVPPSGSPLHEHGRTVLPMKLFTYLAAGRPILAPRLPDLQELLVDGDNALLVAPDDIAQAAASARRLIDDRALAERLARSALSRSQGLSWRARADRLLSQIDAWRCAAAPAALAGGRGACGH